MKNKLTMILAVTAALGAISIYSYYNTKAETLPSKTSEILSQTIENSDIFYESDEDTLRTETAVKYSVYEPYGMTYDKEKDRFFYDGRMVRFFKDEVSKDDLNSFFYSEGTIDVEPIRDSNGNLTGLKKASDEAFAVRTKKENELKLNFQKEKSIYTSGQYDSIEEGEANYEDDKIREAYADYGVTYDTSSGVWLFKGKTISFLNDEGYATYYNGNETNGINIEVIRGKNGEIKMLKVLD